jgi:transcriptional regulator with XRE-family HTH domain
MQKSVHSREATVLREMLRKLREGNGLTQEQFAERLGRPRNYISRYEVGEKMLDVPEVRQLLEALGKPFVEFMKEYDDTLK